MSINYRFLLNLFIIFFITPLAYSQRTDTNISNIAKFESWNVSVVGVQSVDFESLGPVQKKVVYALPPLLSAIIRGVDVRYLSAQEKHDAREIKRKDALITLSNSLEKLLIDDGVKALANETLDIRTNRRNANKKIKELKKRIKTIEALETRKIPIAENLPIVYKEQIKYLNISIVEDLQQVSEELGSHEIIYYRVFTLEGYVVVEILTYNAVQQTNRKLLRTVVDPNNITHVYNSLQLGIQDAILGTPSSALTITVQEAEQQKLYDAEIYLDGSLVGFGEVIFSSLPVGVHSINIIHEGQQRIEVVVLEPHETLHKTYMFKIKVSDTITVMSNPSDARVYINSEWVGNTPTVVPKPRFITLLEVKKDEYDNHKETLTVNSNSSINLILTPINPIPLQERLNLSRKKFYNAFSMFAVSLAVPIILNGFLINETNANTIGSNNLSAEGSAESLQRQTAYFYSFLGTALVSTGLGVFTFFRLKKYLNTASEYHER